MATLKSISRGILRPLSYRNARLLLIGQLISAMGYFIQDVAQAWFVLDETGKGSMLGILVALELLPFLFVSPLSGLLIDRFDHRKLLLSIEIALASVSVVAGALIISGHMTIPILFVCAFLRGTFFAMEMPTRQTFVVQLVDPEDARSALTFALAANNIARVTGPLIGALLIPLAGTGTCFVINGLTAVAVIGALLVMEKPNNPAGERLGISDLADGVKHAWQTVGVRIPLVTILIVGSTTYQLSTTFPLLARYTFESSVNVFALLLASYSLGTITGSFLQNTLAEVSKRLVATAFLWLAVTSIAVAIAPSLLFAIPAAFAGGITNSINLSRLMGMLQASVDPIFRGRITGLWTACLMGSIGIGAPIAGYVGEHFGARSAIFIGTVGALVAACLTWRLLSNETKEVEVNSV